MCVCVCSLYKFWILFFAFLTSYKAGFTAEDLEPFNDMVKKALKLTNATPYEITQFKVAAAIEKFKVSTRDTGSAAIQGRKINRLSLFRLSSHSLQIFSLFDKQYSGNNLSKTDFCLWKYQ